MRTSRACVFPDPDVFPPDDVLREDNRAGLGAFVATILGEDHPGDCPDFRLSENGTVPFAAGTPPSASAAAFAATILGEHNSGSVDAFVADILREYDPDQPRDERGRWTTGGSKEKSLDDLRKEVEKALAPKTPTPLDDTAAKADANSVIFGKRTFTSKDGGTVDARFAGFDDNGQVLLKRAADEKTFAVPLERFSDEDRLSLAKLREDKGFMTGLKAKPANIHLDSTLAKAADQQPEWEAQVIRDIAKLSEWESGRVVLDAAKKQGKQITIKPHSSGDNMASDGTVYYDPGRTIGARAQSGDRERPPFIGLGQEIHNAVVNLSPRTVPLAQKEEGGLRVGQELRVEYNKTIGDHERLEKLTRRYPGSRTYPGWGTKKVDERVLGLDGRPLPRKRDR